MAHTIGSLDVGKQADVVLLDTRKVNTQPVVDPEGTVVVYADTSNIDTVIVGGVIRKRHGQLWPIVCPKTSRSSTTAGTTCSTQQDRVSGKNLVSSGCSSRLKSRGIVQDISRRSAGSRARRLSARRG